jgi:hypothetical protein
MSFCTECNCKGLPLKMGNGHIHQEKNWYCPLTKGNICETCCQVDLAGGMDAGDTLRQTIKKTGKTGAEILKICVACEYGGPELVEPHPLIMARGADGQMKTSGPEFDAADAEFREEWALRLKNLKDGSDS